MSSKPIAPDSGLQQLVDAGYEVEVRQQHLLVHRVPYVTADRQVKLGTMVCLYLQSGGSVLPPNTGGDTHQVWWAGEYPCFADGSPMSQLENEHTRQELFPGCTIDHRFSNKPFGVDAYSDHYQKVTHYANLIQAQARVLEPLATAQTGRLTIAEDGTSVFRYADTASARAEIMTTSARLAMGKVAIVGLGGTGSYVLDQLAKTPIHEIHLFDGDLYLQHNAFRSPGAATAEEIDAKQPKTEYFQGKYDAMHRGVKSHPYYLDASNISELQGFNFVFVCVDKGEARKLIFNYLLAQGIAFVDVGMNLQLVKPSMKLLGSCRVTIATPEKHDHLGQCVPTEDGDDDVLYRQNIQVADMNALNAQLAVMRWKQYCGFYQADFDTYNMLFSVNMTSLARQVTIAETQP
ncbi:ThiF family adenylyltransferase [Paraburkholderia sp. BL17N1]|uniref:ThiF family adenylyltransferase n=1 Tax=Paraburkholderia sp. BL17N1 TaxID=1938798 RepID=UPI000EB44D83|nr:ThiF family adenylyltransferase [Paraburkholderia sp. BL17N1]RKR43747.1 ThiF family protein [Paraburkholderia sp. BL17N1]